MTAIRDGGIVSQIMLTLVSIFLSSAAIGFALSALSRVRIGPGLQLRPWTPGVEYSPDGIAIRQFASEIPKLNDPVPADMNGWHVEQITAVPSEDGYKVTTKFVKDE